MLSTSVLCYGFARLVTFVVTFWGKNSVIFDGKIGVNARKCFAFRCGRVSHRLHQKDSLYLYRVYILQRKASGYKQTWALTHRPDQNWFTGL